MSDKAIEIKELFCGKCGKKMHGEGGVSQTMLAYLSPPGHNHDDNCRNRLYRCECGNSKNISKQNRCDNLECDWKGKSECFCCRGPKVVEWPE